jgi:hypothetical protein
VGERGVPSDYGVDTAMNTELHIVPDTEEEVEFLEMLADAREFALEEGGLEKDEVAAAFSQFAVGMYQEGGKDRSDRFKCPECGEPVEDAGSQGLGQPLVLEPCGHTAEYDEVPDELFLDSDG